MRFDDSAFTPKIHYRPIKNTGVHDRKVERKDLSPDQERALSALLDATYGGARRTSLGGYAGTGKSTLIPIFSQELGAVHSTAFVAYTGKAANGLKRKLKASGLRHVGFSGTIHRLLYDPITNAAGRIIGWQRKQAPLYGEGICQDSPISRIVIDEASMVGERLLEDIEEYQIPIIAVGDHGQLLPIKDVSIFTEPDIRLEQIHRQAADNPIIKLASLVRTRGDIPKDFPESPEIRFISAERAYEAIGDAYERLGLNMAVLVRTNKLRKDLNLLPREDVEPSEGDLVICLKNNPPIYNGMRGIIEKIEPYETHWYQAQVYFPDDGFAVEGLLNRYQFGRERTLESVEDIRNDGFSFPIGLPLGLLFDFGMALTVHKSQGSGFDEVILYPERWSDDKASDYCRWLYTAVTRSAKKLTIVRG